MSTRGPARRGVVAMALASGLGLAGRARGVGRTEVTDDVGMNAGPIRIPVGGAQIRAYRAAPRGVKRPPVVLVVHEIYGLHPHIEDVCRRFAKLGYLAVAPELFARQGNVSGLRDDEIWERVVAHVPDRQVFGDLDATMAWATSDSKGHGRADRERCALVGFSWGGRMAWLYAARTPLRAAVAFYGKLSGQRNQANPRHPIDVVNDLKAPVLGLHGGADIAVPITTVNDLEATLAKARAPAARASIVRVYPAAAHGFFADYRNSYRREDAAEAWGETREWLRRRVSV